MKNVIQMPVKVLGILVNGKAEAEVLTTGIELRYHSLEASIEGEAIDVATLFGSSVFHKEFEDVLKLKAIESLAA